MKVIKITRPTYVGVLAPMIQSYYNKVNVHKFKHVSYETLYAYIAQTVQFGGDMAEFHVCFDNNDKPVGFALWRIMGLPYTGAVYCEHLFKSTKNHEVAVELAREFIEFGKKCKAPYYIFDAVNDAVASALEKMAIEIDVNLTETGTRNFIGRLNNG